jgi:polysaccharide pyruvyl transferase CsaB
MSSSISPEQQTAQKRPLSIVIAGWYGFDNVGDEAFLNQFIRAVGPGPDCHLTVLAANFERSYMLRENQYISINTHPRLISRNLLKTLTLSGIRETINIIKNCDILVVGAGSLIHDRFGLYALLPVIDDIFIAKLFKKKIFLYGLGVGPLDRRLERWLAGLALGKADVLTIRNRESVSIVESLGVPSEKIQLVADPVFLLSAFPISVQRNPLSALPRGTVKCVGVFMCRPPEYSIERMRIYCQQVAAALDEIHRLFHVHFVFLPMSTHPLQDDRVASFMVKVNMTSSEAATVVDYPIPPEEMKWLTGQMDYNIAQRFHAAIFSFSQAVPFVALPYDPKVKGFLNDNALTDYMVEMDQDIKKRLVQAFVTMTENSVAYHNFLGKRSEVLKASAQKIFIHLDKLIADVRAQTPV